MATGTVQVKCEDLQQLIIAASELSEALYQSGYDVKADYILKADKDKTEGENAINFVMKQADLTGAALRMLTWATDIVATALVNDEIEIVPKGE